MEIVNATNIIVNGQTAGQVPENLLQDSLPYTQESDAYLCSLQHTL